MITTSKLNNGIVFSLPTFRGPRAEVRGTQTPFIFSTLITSMFGLWKYSLYLTSLLLYQGNAFSKLILRLASRSIFYHIITELYVLRVYKAENMCSFFVGTSKFRLRLTVLENHSILRVKYLSFISNYFTSVARRISFEQKTI